MQTDLVAVGVKCRHTKQWTDGQPCWT